MRENQIFAYTKTKMRISCAITTQLIRGIVFATQIVKLVFFLLRNFKLLAFFCDCTGRFVSDLVGNPEDRFSRVSAHIEGKKPASLQVTNLLYTHL